MNTVSLTLPEAWVPFLLYGDSEGMSFGEEQAAIMLVDAQGITDRNPLDIAPAGFLWRHDATACGIGGAECVEVTYVIDPNIFENP